MSQLTATDHSRDSAGLTYVYPVLSRRAGGVSIGINLNPNNACNWHCVYCQVPNLVRGEAPPIDPNRFEAELRSVLGEVADGRFFERYQVPEALRTIRDIAISGNGEPTSCRELGRVIEIIAAICRECGLVGGLKRVLISNGSLMQRPETQLALRRWSELGGEVWFKLDSATEAGIRRINGANLKPAVVLRNLEASARACPTWIQTCMFQYDGAPPSPDEQRAYLDFLAECGRREMPLEGVLLYGLARPSLQEEAGRLSPLPPDWLDDLGQRIEALGLKAKVSV